MSYFTFTRKIGNHVKSTQPRKDINQSQGTSNTSHTDTSGEILPQIQIFLS